MVVLAKAVEAVEVEPLCRSERTLVWQFVPLQQMKLTLRRLASHYSWCSRVKTRGAALDERRQQPSEVLLKKYMTIVWLLLVLQLVAGFSHFPPTNLRSSLSSHVMGSRQQCWWTFALGEFLCKHTHPWGYYCDFKLGNKWGFFV